MQKVEFDEENIEFSFRSIFRVISTPILPLRFIARDEIVGGIECEIFLGEEINRMEFFGWRFGFEEIDFEIARGTHASIIVRYSIGARFGVDYC